MAHIYETIIIGATPEGLDLAEQLSGEGRKTIIISSHFRYRTSRHKLNGIELLEATAVFLSFSHGLFGVNVETTTSKGAIFGCNVVFATGTKPIKSSLKNQNIVYKAIDLIGKHKSEPVVIYGNNDTAVSYALDLAKRYCYVYLCTPDFELGNNKRQVKKINETANIVHLQGCNITGCKNDKEGKLVEVSLDTYTNITTKALVVALGRNPDIPTWTKRYLSVLPNGLADVTANCESTLVPGVYAIGAISGKTAKKDIKKLAITLLTKFN